MKKISIFLLAVLMIFSFVACENEPQAQEDVTTREEIVIDYIDSVSFEKAMNDVMSSVEGNESAIKVVFKTDEITMGSSEVIPFTVSVKNYDTGFHEGVVRNVVSGNAEVKVTGAFDEADKTKFIATGYSIKTVEGVVVEDAKFGKHTLTGSVSGSLQATIKLEKMDDKGMQFKLEPGFKYALPEPGENVTISLDGKAVDYQVVFEACNPHTGNMN